MTEQTPLETALLAIRAEMPSHDDISLRWKIYDICTQLSIGAFKEGITAT